MTIGERIRTLRTERGMTQAQVAQRAGGCLLAKHIGAYEHDVHNPRIDTLLALARAFEMSLDEFVRGVDR